MSDQVFSTGVAKSAPLVAVHDLHVEFASAAGRVKAVDGVSFTLEPGETLAMVGESGSGKSVTALALMRLLPPAAGRLQPGHIFFNGADIELQSETAMRRLRGSEIGMVFQEPMTSLNPVMSIGAQIGERLRVHQGLDRRAALKGAIEMLDRVRIPDAARRAGEYPHQMSGGMRQRAMIAMALACRPKLLIADEPTTALDVTIQAQILDLMRGLQQDFGMAILFITHDLGVVAEMADRVVVMYSGQSVEEAMVGDIFARPLMPYTSALLHSIPRVDRVDGSRLRLEAIRGSVPNPLALPDGCYFHPRCDAAQSRCESEAPLLEPCGDNHLVRCSRWRELEAAR